MNKKEAETEIIKYEHLKNKELIHNTYKMRVKVVEIGIAETTVGSRNFDVYFKLNGKVGKITETLEYVLANYTSPSNQIFTIKNENEIIESILKGHKTGLSKLFDQYAYALYSVILNITGDNHLSEKILQQTFCYVWQNIPAYYASNKNIFCWIVSIARELSIGSNASGNHPFETEVETATPANEVVEEKLLELILIRGHDLLEILKKLSISKEEFHRRLKVEIANLKQIKPSENTDNKINPGILELYCLGLTALEENDLILKDLKDHPELQNEIESTLSVIIKYFEKKTKLLNATIKPTILATIDYIQRLKNGEAPSFPPILHKGSKISDYTTWLAKKDMNTPDDYADVFIKIISSQISVITAIVWLKEDVPYEEHNYEYEKFLILEGSCEILLSKKVVSLEKGDYFSVPLHVEHFIKVTSKIPCKLILQKIAA